MERDEGVLDANKRDFFLIFEGSMRFFDFQGR